MPVIRCGRSRFGPGASPVQLQEARDLLEERSLEPPVEEASGLLGLDLGNLLLVSLGSLFGLVSCGIRDGPDLVEVLNDGQLRRCILLARSIPVLGCAWHLVGLALVVSQL